MPLRLSSRPTADGSPLEVVFLIDTTEIMAGTIGNLRVSLSQTVLSGIRGAYPDSKLAVATFSDFPINPYGQSGDLPYKLVQPLTSATTDIQVADQYLGGSRWRRYTGIWKRSLVPGGDWAQSVVRGGALDRPSSDFAPVRSE